ncbi:MAG TPA: acyl-CoA dehydrogenase family protein [Acidimicrobiales bacterium]
MDLEFSTEEAELRDNVRSVLAASCPPSLVRSIFEGSGDAESLWKQMVDLYWPGLAIPEPLGGLGMGYVEVAIVVEELGRVVAPGPFLPTVTQFAPAVRSLGEDRHHEHFLSAVASGELTGSLALAEEGAWEPAAVRTVARHTGDAWRLSGSKSSVLSGAPAFDELVVVARAEGTHGLDGLGAFVIPWASVETTSRRVIDPTLPLVDVRLDDVEVPEERVLAAPGAEHVPAALAVVLEEATAAVALSTVGTCRSIFESTLDYAKVREQYGRPIGSFQALKHRFADLYLSLERATSLCYFAALTIAEDDPRRSEAVSLAKAAVGDCQRLMAQDGLQLHGGIGFTWENDLHFLLKRAKCGDPLFGSAAWHRGRLAEQHGLLEVSA